MGIPLAHYKSEFYRDANIVNNRKIIGNVRIRFGNHKGIGRGVSGRLANTNNIYNNESGCHARFFDLAIHAIMCYNKAIITFRERKN